MEITILTSIFTFIILIFSIMIHEIAHGSVAHSLGDSTAKDDDRLTLNPIKHIDPMGTIILPLFLIILKSQIIIGWAKPVPINFNNITDKRWGALKIALAGPLANFILAVIFALLIRFLPMLSPGLYYIFEVVIIYNLILAIFNLIPIPPLDGSHILFDFLPQGETLSKVKSFLTTYGFFILIFFVFIFPGIDWIFNLAEAIYYFLAGQPFV
ncbi:MAG: site-2 protease family protein [Candidatus Paceibacterota bacterium]